MIRTKTAGVQQAKAKSTRVLKALDLRKVNKGASIFLDQWVQRNFKGEGDKVGGWEPFLYGGRLTPKKAGGEKGKAGKYINPSAKLMMDSGTLRSSFHPFSDKRQAGIGSKLPYAKQHDQGEDGTIQRRLLPEDGEVQTELKRMYGTHVRTALNV